MRNGNGPVATYGAASLDKSSATEGHHDDTSSVVGGGLR